MSSMATDIRSAGLARTDPAQPYVTYLGSDGRMELSGASVNNAAAKIANALTSEFDCDPGQRVALHLPWHWQRITWLLGIWSAGCVVVPQGGGDCDLLVAGPKIDKEHLRFEVLGGKCLMRDHETKHGTKLNMRLFEGTTEITPGDRISLPRAGGFNVLAMNAKGRLIGVKKKKK